MSNLPILYPTGNVEGNGTPPPRDHTNDLPAAECRIQGKRRSLRTSSPARHIGSLLTCFILTGFLTATFFTTSAEARKRKPEQNIPANLQEIQTEQVLGFVPNEGQWPSSVLYRAETPGFAVWVTRDGLRYQFSRPVGSAEENDVPIDHLSPRSARPVEHYTVDVTFSGSTGLSIASGQQMLEKRVNFILGSDPSLWKSNLPSYAQVVIPGLYAGIDLLLSSANGHLQYDFVVAPGADFSKIKVQYDGAENLRVGSSGELLLSTPWGEIIEQPPVSYQTNPESGEKVEIKTHYQQLGESSFGFTLLDGYDFEQPLLIDPIVSYSSYIGGSSDDGGLDIEALADQTAILVGYTASNNFPKLLGLDTSYNGAPNDIFVSKISATGNSFVYSSYIGGSLDDVATSVTSDGSGNIYITGYTTSTNFPTVSPIDGSHNTDWDIFVLKLNATGSALNFSTYIGGSNKDRGDEIILDNLGNLYLTGFTRSTNFPVTASAYDTSANGSWDAFALKINAAGSSITYATYLGGSVDDFGYALAVDTAGNCFVAGQTSSTDFPTASAYQAATGGSVDGFFTKLAASGSSLVFSSYFGGNQGDWIEALQLDPLNKVYLCGVASSTNFPIVGAYDNSYNGGGGDCFASRLSASGLALQFSTFIGGTGFDRPTAMILDDTLRINLVGYTQSNDYPTMNAIDGSPDSTDVIITRLSPTGNALQFSTYLGGTAIDYAYSVDFLASEQTLYLTGTTNSINYPDLFQIPSARGTGYDVFATQIAPFFDTDGDGVSDASDNCISIANPSQANADLDAFGDACDLCTDTDGDGFGNPGFAANTCPTDNCPTTANASQANADGDALGDACDLCPLDPLNDADGDGICANIDNCPTRFNPLQEDSNFDGIGDSCSNTAVGSSVVVNLPVGITVTFPTVTQAGLTEVNISNSGPAADPTFGIIPISNSEYYYFSTTALYTGSLTVTITYDQADVTGSEANLSMRSRHTGAWTNVTTNLNTSTNVITGVVPSLSIIAIATTSCCQGVTGNIDCDPGDNVDIGDLTVLVDHLFLSFDPLCCTKEANVDGVGGTSIDIADLTKLVDHLFVSFGATAACL